jgi:DNA-binding transcriptional regulator LsrR (DeoR family)
VISTIENSNKFQKTRLWKEKSVENVVTLGATAHATLVYVAGIGKKSEIVMKWRYLLEKVWDSY